MKRLINKYEANTLLEVIMVMLIIGIIIYLSYSVITFMNSYAYNAKKDFEELSEVIIFSSAFNRDLYSAKEIEIQNRQLRLYGNDTVIYNFFSGNIFRESQGQMISMGLAQVQFTYSRVRLDNEIFWEFLINYETWKKDPMKLKFYRTTISTDSLIVAYEAK